MTLMQFGLFYTGFGWSYAKNYTQKDIVIWHKFCSVFSIKHLVDDFFKIFYKKKKKKKIPPLIIETLINTTIYLIKN